MQALFQNKCLPGGYRHAAHRLGATGSRSSGPHQGLSPRSSGLFGGAVSGPHFCLAVAQIPARLPVRFVVFMIERSEEHTSELQSLMRISYAVYCLTKKKQRSHEKTHLNHNSNYRNHKAI